MRKLLVYLACLTLLTSGYEVQHSSYGYLLERARHIGALNTLVA